MKLRAHLAAALLLACGASVSSAQCPDPTPSAQLGGSVTAVTPIRLGWTLIGRGNKVQVMRTPDGAAPTVYAEYALNGPVTQVWSFGGFGYAVAGNQLHRFDRLTNATDPLQLVSSYSPSDTFVLGKMVCYLDRVCIVKNWSTISVIDYTNPAAPVEVATHNFNTLVSDVAGWGWRLYLATDRGVKVMDVADADNPQVVADFSIQREWKRIDAFNVGGGVMRLILNPSTDPGAISIMDLINNDTQWVARSFGHYNIAYVQDINRGDIVGTHGITRLNITDPVNPYVADYRVSTDGDYFGINSFEGRTLVAGGQSGLLVLDDANLDLQQQYRPLPAAANQVALRPGSGIAYVADGYTGVRAVQLDAANATHLGGADFGGYGRRIAASQSIVAVLDMDRALFNAPGTLRTYSISHSSLPVFRNSLALDTIFPGDLAFDGSRVVAALAPTGYARHLTLIDVAPNTPVQLTDFDTGVQIDIRGLVVRDHVAYIVQGNQVKTFAIGAASITPLDTATVAADNFFGLALVGDLLLAVSGGAGLGRVEIYDVQDPANLHRLGGTDVDDNALGVAAAGNWAAVVGDSLQFIEISNPARPRVVSATAELPHVAQSITAADFAGQTRFIVSELSCGLHIYTPPADFRPIILHPPQDVPACIGGSATFTAEVLTSNDPANPPIYQWQRYINNTAQNIPGANAPTFTLTNIGMDDLQWGYRITVRNDCGIAHSEAAHALVCPADFNCSGAANSQDFFDFLAVFFAGAARADINGDGAVNSQDYFDFLAALFAGC